MRFKKKIIWIPLVLTLLLVLTGCNQNQQAIFNAAMNMQDAKSMQAHTSMTFRLSGSGFEPAVQQQVDTAAAFLNNAKLDLDVKTSGNEQKTVSRSKVDMNLVTQGMNIDVPCWVDSDLTSNTPKVSEIIKLPQIASASLPTQFASKEYMVINPYEITNSGLDEINITKLTEFSKSFYAAEIAFLNSYSKRFNPNVDVVSCGSQNVQTNAGLKEAQIYEVKLNDAQFKDFIRYTVNNFAQDTEAMNFVKDFMGSILEISSVPDKAKTINDFDQAFKQFEVSKPQFLAKFNSVMDQLNAVTFLGDQGLELKYAISDGYCVQESGTLNFEINMAQINQLMNTLSAQESTAADAKGILNLQINFNTDVSGINSSLELKIPEVNSDNSFNYQDLIKGIPAIEGRKAEQF
jgi:hypothetical protein